MDAHNRKVKKDKYIKRYVYTCAHCGTGMVARLPARCPECDKVLTEEVQCHSYYVAKEPTYSLFKQGDLVSFVGYHYSPDYKYIDEDDYSLGLVIEVVARYIYEPLVRVFWFKKGFATDVPQAHLRLVVKEKRD